MKSVFVGTSHILSPLGNGTSANLEKISNEISGVSMINDTDLLPKPFYGAKIEREWADELFSQIGEVSQYTFLEKIMLLSLDQVISQGNIEITSKTGLFISSTKGNIDLLSGTGNFPKERVYLDQLGKQLKSFFGFKRDAVVVSNACVSGILTLAIAKRMIQYGQYDNALVVSGDILSKFVLSGFASFQALSTGICKPFSDNRSGINLGEAAAAVYLTDQLNEIGKDAIEIIGDGSCNDANHISGPSRTGEGLYRSIQVAMEEAKITPEKIDYISAHGTATNYNDEMEAIAFDRAGLLSIPLNSLKGYYGHTLGAAGLVEAIIGMGSLRRNELYKSAGFENLGVSKPIQVITKTKKKQLHAFLKTASGFGGCNSAVIFRKVIA